MTDQTINNAGDTRKYFATIPHIADDDLPPFAYRLYGHYVRVCGMNGTCFENTRTTAKKTKMSIGMVSKTRELLAQLGWIKIDTVDEYVSLQITLTDKWPENMARYADGSYSEQPVHTVNNDVHKVNRRVHAVNQRITSEEELSKEEPIKDEGAVAPHEPIITRDHQAIIIFRSVFNRYPDKLTWQDIGATVSPDLSGKWHDVLKWWLLHGFSKVNIGGMLDKFRSYIAGEPLDKFNGSGQPKQPAEAERDPKRFIKGKYADIIEY